MAVDGSKWVNSEQTAILNRSGRDEIKTSQVQSSTEQWTLMSYWRPRDHNIVPNENPISPPMLKALKVVSCRGMVFHRRLQASIDPKGFAV